MKRSSAYLMFTTALIMCAITQSWQIGATIGVLMAIYDFSFYLTKKTQL